MGNYMSSKVPTRRWSILRAEVQKLGEDFEVELDDGLEGDEFLQQCKRNPDHTNMTVMSEFTRNDIPAAWRTTAVFDEIVDFAKEVVKISIPYVSSDRPDKYACSQYKGQKLPFPAVGSGYFYKDPQADKDMHRNVGSVKCPLPHCPIPGDHETTPPFEVKTACHVVYDSSEAEEATVEFFFDSADRSSVIQAEGLSVTTADRDNDQTTLLCVSHNLDLLGKLQPSKLSIQPQSTQGGSTSTGSSVVKQKAPLVVAISHLMAHSNVFHLEICLAINTILMIMNNSKGLRLAKFGSLFNQCFQIV